jgi:PadR family transcriptional regulator PadR
MGADQPRITPQTLKVLAVLMSEMQGEISGAEIGRMTNLASGTLYPILMRLEEAGWAESSWEVGDPHKMGRPRRRLYRITDAGIEKAQLAVRDITLPFKGFAWR